MRNRPTPARPWLLAAALLVFASPIALGQTSDEVIDYMLANRISLAGATDQMGLDMFDVAEDLGYDGPWEALNAQIETALLFAECWSIFVLFNGSAEDIGLDREAVSQYFELRMANDASFLPKCQQDDRRSELSFSMEIWTVGEDYPVAYNVEVTGNIYPEIERGPRHPVESEWLGYANAERVPSVIRENTEEFVESFALTLLRVRGLGQ